jgi:putative peptidoglycan lipid II flippase
VIRGGDVKVFKKVIRNTSLSSTGTLISRCLGFIRDIILANFFGTLPILEAFLVAFRLPNLFRSIFGEGFADSIAVPILAEYQKDKNRIFGISNNLISLLFIVLSAATLLGVIFSKYLVMLIAPGFLAEPDKFHLAVSFTRVTFFYLLLIGLSVNISAILYSLKKFFIPSVTPAFLNVSFIVGIIFFSRFFENYILVICVVVAGFIQIIFPYVFLKKEGFSLKINFKNPLKDTEIIRMLKLFPPRIWSSVVYHLSVVLDTIFCSFTSIVGQGALVAVHYANRLIQFPLALIVIPISRVIIVDLSSYHKDGNMKDFKKLFVFSFQNIVFFIIPVAIIYLFLSESITDVIFKRGEFNIYSLEITSLVVFCYSFGLFFFCGIKLLVNTFYALKDTFIPAKTTAICLLINGILSAILMFPFKVGGVALGSSLAAMVNCLLLYRALVKKIGKIEWEDSMSQFIKVLMLSIISGASSRILWEVMVFSKYLKILIVIGFILSIFIIGGSILRIKQINYVIKRVKLNKLK